MPLELLLAVGQAETGLQMVRGDVEFDGRPGAWGLMGLRGADLEDAAALAGLPVAQVQEDPVANVLAAAKLLEAWADELGIDGDDLAAWAPVVARYGGIDDDQATAEYVHYQVYDALRHGVHTEGYVTEPLDVQPDWPAPSHVRGVDGGAVWTPSPNWNSRSGAAAEFLIVHTCEGSYSSCWSWLASPASGVSAHYVVSETGSEVRALVDEGNRAWHIAADYDCALNGGLDCWRNGTSMNTISVGIEHAGHASQSFWDPGLIARSAQLACGITQRNPIPRDSHHIVGHGQLQPWNRSDPGAAWPWADYLNQIQAACGDAPAPAGAIVVDSNNGANDLSRGYIEVSPSWTASANVSGYWNTGYWVGPTDAVSDAARFWFHADAAGCWDVDAWWPAASDRPAAITWIGWNEDASEVGRTVVDQRGSGAQWNRLGTWSFGAGWNRVLLSRWSDPGAFAVADAVRLTPVSCP
ncbi:MAG: N-acetylmuramoyl-L-alanine amidase [Myxococcota bacterium]